MEKSRAIELLEHLAWERDIERNPYGDALNMAIEALKAQLSQQGTTSDLISRQEAIDALDCINGVEEVLRSLPGVQPERAEGEWIRVHPLQNDDSGAYMCSKCKLACGKSDHQHITTVRTAERK